MCHTPSPRSVWRMVAAKYLTFVANLWFSSPICTEKKKNSDPRKTWSNSELFWINKTLSLLFESLKCPKEMCSFRVVAPGIWSALCQKKERTSYCRSRVKERSWIADVCRGNSDMLNQESCDDVGIIMSCGWVFSDNFLQDSGHMLQASQLQPRCLKYPTVCSKTDKPEIFWSWPAYDFAQNLSKSAFQLFCNFYMFCELISNNKKQLRKLLFSCDQERIYKTYPTSIHCFKCAFFPVDDRLQIKIFEWDPLLDWNIFPFSEIQGDWCFLYPSELFSIEIYTVETCGNWRKCLGVCGKAESMQLHGFDLKLKGLKDRNVGLLHKQIAHCSQDP